MKTTYEGCGRSHAHFKPYSYSRDSYNFCPAIVHFRVCGKMKAAKHCGGTIHIRIIEGKVQGNTYEDYT